MRITHLAMLVLIFIYSAYARNVPVKNETSSLNRARDYLIATMDQYHTAFNVYTDFNSGGNHFVYKAKISSHNSLDTVPPMDEGWPDSTRPGSTVIRANFLSRGDNWGGWLFMNGVWDPNEIHEPAATCTLKLKAIHGKDIANFDTCADAGVNLNGATKLTFFARGEHGGERVEFFTFGAKWETCGNKKKRLCPYGDSSEKISTGIITLSKEWKPYEIPITDKRQRPIYVVNGFGWAANAILNNNKDSIFFYLDDIKYNVSRLEEPRLLRSFTCLQPWDPNYLPIDYYQFNAAHTYDNALALMAFIALDDTFRARLIADALVYAVENDRFYNDGRIRSVYMAGELKAFPGWIFGGKRATARLIGVWDNACAMWLEDLYSVSTTTGNVAWTMLALINYYQCVEKKDSIPALKSRYIQTAIKLGNWVIMNCSPKTNFRPGFTGGFTGWDLNTIKCEIDTLKSHCKRYTTIIKETYKSSEHNIDLYAAFKRLHNITRDPKWEKCADMVKIFILDSMWDTVDCKFWTGTQPNDSINKTIHQMPVDAQAWSILSFSNQRNDPFFRDSLLYFARGLDYAEKHMKYGQPHDSVYGFDFNDSVDGVWYEGTAHVAAAYNLLSTMTADSFYSKSRDELLQACERAMCKDTNKLLSGGIPAASKDSLETGFQISVFKNDSICQEPWYYFHRLHVGATAWYILAKTGRNPFWMGDDSEYRNHWGNNATTKP
ncbi:MAG: hypothetical protein JXB48_24175 [Candidatus Latescibacteria bacterium]|nr:hypothetical protein [Candidatus Latescibacterota bacterium]